MRARQWRSFSHFRRGLPSAEVICDLADFVHEAVCQLYTATDISAEELAMVLRGEVQFWDGVSRKPREEVLERLDVHELGCLDEIRDHESFQAPPEPPAPEPPEPPEETPEVPDVADVEESNEAEPEV